MFSLLILVYSLLLSSNGIAWSYSDINVKRFVSVILMLRVQRLLCWSTLLANASKHPVQPKLSLLTFYRTYQPSCCSIVYYWNGCKPPDSTRISLAIPTLILISPIADWFAALLASHCDNVISATKNHMNNIFLIWTTSEQLFPLRVIFHWMDLRNVLEGSPWLNR